MGFLPCIVQVRWGEWDVYHSVMQAAPPCNSLSSVGCRCSSRLDAVRDVSYRCCAGLCRQHLLTLHVEIHLPTGMCCTFMTVWLCAAHHRWM